jgi:hypothetical protein
MKAIQIDKYRKGNVKVMLRDVEIPAIGEHDVLVSVQAAGVNPLDVLIAHGDVRLLTPYQFPLTMGNEMVSAKLQLSPWQPLLPARLSICCNCSRETASSFPAGREVSEQ